jgi:hypothetical protein
MYPFKTRTKSAPISRFPVDDNEVQLGLPDSSVFFVKTPNTAAIIRRCTTMPETGEEQYPSVEIKRTSSCGLLFRRKRSVEKQVKINRARALEMSERFEQSDIKDESLNKNANFKIPSTGTPSFSAAMTAKQAAKVFEKEQLEAKKKTAAADPLLTERERKGKERPELIEQQTSALARTLPISQLSRAPFSVKQMNTDGRSLNSRFSFTKPHSSQEGKHKGSGYDILTDSMGIEIIPLSPTSVSVAPTEPETPSPREHREIYHQTPRLPSMC